jgi:GNAT superfamily N-acetyltransferase
MSTGSKIENLDQLSQVERLGAKHRVEEFASGNNSLDFWLRKYALTNQSLANSPQTYVVHRGGRVVGYYSLVYGEVSLEHCPPRIKESMPSRYPVPVIKLARLAVDKKEQGSGLGTALMKDVFLRTIAAAEIAGLRALVVDALNERAKRFYCEKFAFDESPIGPLQLFLRIDDVRVAIEASAIGRTGQ